MIDKEKHPVGWAALMYELEDAHEHLAELIADIDGDPDFSEEEFRVHLGHIYSHLNRAWYRRNIPEDFPEQDWDAASEYPKDVAPI